MPISHQTERRQRRNATANLQNPFSKATRDGGARSPKVSPRRYQECEWPLASWYSASLKMQCDMICYRIFENFPPNRILKQTSHPQSGYCPAMNSLVPKLSRPAFPHRRRHRHRTISFSSSSDSGIVLLVPVPVAGCNQSTRYKRCMEQSTVPLFFFLSSSFLVPFSFREETIL